MTRLVVAGTPEAVATATTDKTTVPGSGTQVRYSVVVPGQQFQVYGSQSGTDLITDLVDVATGAPVATITADDVGQLPATGLPDGLRVDGVWLDPIDTSSTRFYVQVRFGPAAFDLLLQANPQLIAAVAALVTSGANLPSTKPIAYLPYGDEFVMLDAAGNLTKFTLGPDGEMGEGTVQSLMGKGMPRGVGTGMSWQMVTEDGVPLPLDFNFLGNFGPWFRRQIINTIHMYRGPDRPEPLPLDVDGTGGVIRWWQTDADGNDLGPPEGVDVVYS